MSTLWVIVFIKPSALIRFFLRHECQCAVWYMSDFGKFSSMSFDWHHVFPRRLSLLMTSCWCSPSWSIIHGDHIHKSNPWLPQRPTSCLFGNQFEFTPNVFQITLMWSGPRGTPSSLNYHQTWRKLFLSFFLSFDSLDSRSSDRIQTWWMFCWGHKQHCQLWHLLRLELCFRPGWMACCVKSSNKTT